MLIIKPAAVKQEENVCVLVDAEISCILGPCMLMPCKCYNEYWN